MIDSNYLSSHTAFFTFITLADDNHARHRLHIRSSDGDIGRTGSCAVVLTPLDGKRIGVISQHHTPVVGIARRLPLSIGRHSEHHLSGLVVDVGIRRRHVYRFLALIGTLHDRQLLQLELLDISHIAHSDSSRTGIICTEILTELQGDGTTAHAR